MRSWLLLALTIGIAYLAYDAFRSIHGIDRAPFQTISSLWKGKLSYLSAKEKSEVHRRYSSVLFGVGGLP
ncbi:MAG TPA: hypothetical protein VFS24_19950, partial [Steroidobacteraceae bacterium]|nr:hypothetical protein [Steroidobacteraceae bacterium]